MNNIFLIGKVNATPKYVARPDKVPYCEIEIAHVVEYEKKGGDTSTFSQYLKFLAFGKLADKARALKHGDHVFVEATLLGQWREYKGKEFLSETKKILNIFKVNPIEIDVVDAENDLAPASDDFKDDVMPF